QAALPLFDDVDRINQRSVFTYGVTSRLLGRLSVAPPTTEKKDKEHHPGTPKTAKDEARVWSSSDDHDDGSIGDGLEAEPRAPTSRGIRELARFSLFQSYDFANKL